MSEVLAEKKKTAKGGGEKKDKTVLTVPEGVDLSEFEEESYTEAEIQTMMEAYGEVIEEVKEGNIIKGTVVKVTDDDVFVDIKFKSEGVIPLSEFKDPSELKVGQEIELFLEKVEDKNGNVVLSKERADFMRIWEKLKDAEDTQEIVEGVIQRKIKGGLVVDLMGVDAFLPRSQIELRQVPDMDSLIGKKLNFRIIKINKIRRNVVVSRRVVLEDERKQMREKLVGKIDKGMEIEGIVKNITDFGAFIDLGGLDGLLHITDMSWGRVNHPSEVVAFGDKVKVMVLDYNENKDRISLGMKQLKEPPWKDFENKYPIGSKIKGKIVSITDYGAFMALDGGIEGLIHVSEMSWTQHIKHPSKVVEVGDVVEAIVLKVDKENQKISLGLKQLSPDPWQNIEADFPVGSRHSGAIRNIAAFGVFVELQEGIEGLVHVSDMSWTKKISQPGAMVKKGDVVDVVVLNVDKEKRRISLGMKQVEEDPWGKLEEKYAIGTDTEGEIARLLDRGVIVTLDDDVEGFVPMGKLAINNIEKPQDAFKVGEKIMLKVIEFEQEERKIVLSAEDYYKDKDASELEAYVSGHTAS